MISFSEKKFQNKGTPETSNKKNYQTNWDEQFVIVFDIIDEVTFVFIVFGNSWKVRLHKGRRQKSDVCRNQNSGLIVGNSGLVHEKTE